MNKIFLIIFCWMVCIGQCWGMPILLDDSLRSKVMAAEKLSDKEVRLFKNIFRDIEKEDISVAQKKLSQLKNASLIGHAEAEIYLSKTYKSSAKELKSWLKKYHYLPQARAIYNLAVVKAGRGGVENPWGEKYPLIYSPYSWFNNQYEVLSNEDRKYVRGQVSNFRRHINKGQSKAARQILENSKFRKVIPDKEYDSMSVTLATIYLLDNQNHLAWQWVQKAANRSDDAMAYWVGGLAAWRLKQYKNAAAFFARLGSKSKSDEWLVSAGGYWAYRSYTRAGNKKEAQKNLKLAAQYKRTFYGMLAAYQLGEDWHFNWKDNVFINNYETDEYIKQLLKSPSARRSIILLMAKAPRLAEKEIRSVYPKLSAVQKEALLLIAQQQGMHSLAILLANDIKNNKLGHYYDKAAYPLPVWQPREGWEIEKAFALGVMRQESLFNPKANSRAGAKGLMQLMPATAFHISKNPKIKQDSTILFNPSYNLSLGQKYIKYLSGKDFINRNMFYIISAYNAGPGNLYKWQKKVAYGNDPLLFIEVIPARETRIYVERVMANYWMYMNKLGKKNKSIEALSKGEWPKL